MTGLTSRSWLFVPGTRPERFAKAIASGADEVVLDLEDAVAPADKAAARIIVADWLGAGNAAWVRVNAGDTAAYADDLAALVDRDCLRGIMLPKAEDPAALLELSERLTPQCGVVPLVETALGLHRALDLARAGHVTRLAFGSLDFAADIGADPDDDALLFARSTLVNVSRVAGVGQPIDGVTATLHDLEILTSDVRRARRFGFGGKLCIHPEQIAPVHLAFRPDADQLAWARRVLEAGTEVGAANVDGEMVDQPVLKRAQQLLRRADVGTS